MSGRNSDEMTTYKNGKTNINISKIVFDEYFKSENFLNLDMVIVILPFAGVTEVETFRSHDQPLLRGESAQGHERAVVVVRPHSLCCNVLHLREVSQIVMR